MKLPNRYYGLIFLHIWTISANTYLKSLRFPLFNGVLISKHLPLFFSFIQRHFQ